MVNLDSVRAFLRYGDWANEQVFRAGMALTDAQLDQAFDMGRGTLRKTLLHIWAGECVWVSRWQGKTETPWPNEEVRESAASIAERLTAVYRERDGFLELLRDADLARVVTYRDSKGSLFNASLGEMMMQMIVHSIHHRSQAVNMIRRVGGGSLEMDYMMWVRRRA